MSKETRERAEQAADDCEVPVGTWLRMVIEDALDAHEDVELVESESNPEVTYEVRRRLGLCTCPGFEHHGHCKHLADVSESYDSPTESAEEYAARVEAEASEIRSAGMPAVVRVQHPGEVLAQAAETKADAPVVLDARDCPHHPAWVRGGRCRCGTKVAGRGGMMRR